MRDPGFRRVFPLISLIIFASLSILTAEPLTDLYNQGIYLIPYPQEVTLTGEDFKPGKKLSVVLDKNSSQRDRFAAAELLKHLQTEWAINASITEIPSGPSIILTHKEVPEKIKMLSEKKSLQAYELTTGTHQLVIRAKGEAGLFYGIQTLLQIMKMGSEGAFVPRMRIIDWPDISERACHYDTKHHQDKRDYVESFIRDLASYKINMLVWEWEDKFEYPSHPEIGAPGAFTMEEMKEITKYAKQYHVQLVPLVQGLGHVSYILKWPQYSHLRELPSSNWEFCPLNEGSYELLNDLWEDAIEATPGSEYIHIGSDETYELGLCEQCEQKSTEIGRSGLYHLFTSRAGKHLKARGRKTMCWERPMGWAESKSPAKGIEPFKDLVLTESYNFETADFKHAREAKDMGFEIFTYDPNPGIEPLFLPYFFKLKGEGADETEVDNCLQRSHNEVSLAAISGHFDGMINTSWDDSGLHNQVWMMSFINSAEWSWSGANPSLEEFIDKFFLNYYGEQSRDMKELFLLLNKGAYYYYKSFERRVWHYGDIGKTHLPDLPRGDNLEYNEYWNREYAIKIDESREQIKQMNRAMEIIQKNQDAGVQHSYDLEIYTSIVHLVNHTCNTYLVLSTLEKAIKEAQNRWYINRNAAIGSLENAVEIIKTNLSERERCIRNW